MDLQLSENSFTVDDESQDVEAMLRFIHEETQKSEVSVKASYSLEKQTFAISCLFFFVIVFFLFFFCFFKGPTN